MKYYQIFLADAIAIIVGSLFYTISHSYLNLQQFNLDARFTRTLVDSASFIAIGSVPFILVSLLVLWICRTRDLGKHRTSRVMLTTAGILTIVMFTPLLAIILDDGADVESLSLLMTPIAAFSSMAFFTIRSSGRPWPAKPFGFLEV